MCNRWDAENYVGLRLVVLAPSVGAAVSPERALPYLGRPWAIRCPAFTGAAFGRPCPKVAHASDSAALRPCLH